jgi:SAM-dependent methyltransferase
MEDQKRLDVENAEFWNELCGTQFARALGIVEITPATLARFDEAYLGFYPYLSGYVHREPIRDRDVLEIGLGYGTLSQLLARSGASYWGSDIARNPVDVVRGRLRLLGIEPAGRVRVATALDLPWPDQSFDYVYSIGCLHHTGQLSRAVAEVHRVLRPGGVAVVMLYNRHSFRQLVERIRGRRGAQAIRALYDADTGGNAAPHTDYVSVREARGLFGAFTDVRVRRENFDAYSIRLPRRRLRIPRERLLGLPARLLGLDLYIRAQK